MTKDWFQNKPIRAKILLIFIPLAIIPFVAIGITTTIIFRQVLLKETIENIDYEQTLIGTRIKTMMEQIDNHANILANGIINIWQKNNYQNYQNEYLRYTNIKAAIDNIVFPVMINNRNIQSITIVFHDDNIYSTEKSIENKKMSSVDTEIINTLTNSSNQNILFPMTFESMLVKSKNEPVMILGKKLSTSLDMSNFAIMLITIPEQSFEDIYGKNIDRYEFTEYYILDEKGYVISSSEKEELTSAYQKIAAKKQKYLVIEKEIYYDWKIIIKMPWRGLLRGVNYIVIATASVLLSGIFCIAVGTNKVTKILFSPLEQLVKNLNDLTAYNLKGIIYQGHDEVSLLNLQFHMMTENINQLTVNIKNEQKTKNKITLALLQTQIKPHFLYNVLDLIFVLCDMGKCREARDATKALADFYRTLLSNGQEVINVKDEIKNIEAYLFLQKKRYSCMFDYSISASNEIREYKIMKMTIQPIIENSIYHGLKNINRRGIIEILFEQKNGQMIVTVHDNGTGMTNKRLEDVKCEIVKRDINNKAFGLSNIDKRIKLNFGEMYGIILSSVEGEGTIVTIILPIIKDGVSVNV
jgi:two-component system sensor histidine kinase YesM